MSRQSAIDAPVLLGDLLGDDDLGEFVALGHALAGVHVSLACDERRAPGGGDLDASAGLAPEPAQSAGAAEVAAAGDAAGWGEGAVAPDAGVVAALTSSAAEGTPARQSVARALAAVAGGQMSPDDDLAIGLPDVEPALAHAVGRFRYQGRHVATLVLGPYRVAQGDGAAGEGPAALSAERARALLVHLLGVLDLLVHHAHARFLTTAVHTEAMQESFLELEAKNERLEQAVDHMQEVDRLKSSFLATVSHELRTPLTSVIGYAEMLHEGLAGAVNAEQREYLQTILGKADQLLQLITSLLEASILESGPVPMQREPIVVRDMVERVLSGLGPRARSRRIASREIDPDLPPALGDARKIRQVLSHLVANAVKFTADGGQIAISAAVGPLARAGAEDAPQGLRITVADSGIGIPPEQQEHIFEPFFQVDSSSTRKYGGTGLGLTLAKSYIEANGGHIWVESTLGQGSMFTFSVPIAPAPTPARAAAEPAAGGGREPAAARAPTAGAGDGENSSS